MAVSVTMLKIGGPERLVPVRDWYAKYLPLEVVDEVPGRYVFLAGSHGARLAFHTGEALAIPDAVSLYIQVDNVDELYRALRSQGVPFILAPEDRVWGGRVTSLKDPAGHVVKPFHPIEQRLTNDMYPGDPLYAKESDGTHDKR